ncbi:helix-turn-helix domain-containing protein [uncultured Kordia sp.]|uniref:helix-turn-helix domain-containing protein n=1 Tax=uncultured Kordia sp. TaxID=507699 RepID=UPI00262188D6|nr:helix-turn-helix domain-containing protein [uncultured Kordia sp.]
MKSIVCTLPITRIQARYFSLFTVFLLVFNLALAQEKDSIHDTLVSSKMQSFISESDSIDEIEEIIVDTYYDQDFDLGLAYSKIYLKRGKKEENDTIRLFSNSHIARNSYYLAQYEDALKTAYVATILSEKLKDTANIVSNNVTLGSSFYILGDLDNALKAYLRGKELASLVGNTSDEITCLNNIANINAKLDQQESALESYNSILKLLDKEEKPLSERSKNIYLSALLGKLLCHAELKQFDEAKDTYEIGMAIAEKEEILVAKGRFTVNLANMHYIKGEYLKALDLLRQGKKMLDASSLQNNIYITDYYIARTLSKLERYEEAITLIDDVFERVGDNTLTDKIEEMYDLAIEISKIQGNQDKLVHYLTISDEIDDKKHEREKAARELLFDSSIKEQILKNEKLENENSQTLVDKKIIMAVSIILVSILLLIFLSYHRKAKLKEQKFLAIIDEISKKTALKKPEKTQKPQNSSTIKDEKANAILEELETLEETHFYLSSDVTLHTTAKLLNTNTTYLSKALNAVKKQTFSQYLNKLRIDYVLIKLKEDAVFRSYTIHAISKEIGYKSATTFIKEFKNKTGLNPSYYIKKIES